MDQVAVECLTKYCLRYKAKSGSGRSQVAVSKGSPHNFNMDNDDSTFADVM